MNTSHDWHAARTELVQWIEQQRTHAENQDQHVWIDAQDTAERFFMIDDYANRLVSVQQVESESVQRWLAEGHGEDDYLVVGFRRDIAIYRAVMNYLYQHHRSLFCGKFAVPEWVVPDKEAYLQQALEQLDGFDGYLTGQNFYFFLVGRDGSCLYSEQELDAWLSA